MLRETAARCGVSRKVTHPCCGKPDAHRGRSVLYVQMRCVVIQQARGDAWSLKEKLLTVYDSGGLVAKGLCCVVPAVGSLCFLSPLYPEVYPSLSWNS